jgi:prepilin-type N-terminal cleavage/methylation domain-containing protein
MLNKKKTSQQGFSLLECLFAMVITVVGVLAVEMLIVSSIRTQTLSSNATIANALAKAKLEELQALPSSNAARTNGGDLATNVANYSDTSNPKFIRRWRLAAASVGTQNVTVVVLPAGVNVTAPTVQVETLMK